MSLLDDLQAMNGAFNAAVNCGDANAAAQQFTDTAVCIAPTDPVVQETADLPAWFQSWIDAGLKTSWQGLYRRERRDLRVNDLHLLG